MKGKMTVLFDWKAMGGNAYIPLGVIMLLFVYGLFKNHSVASFIPGIETCIPIFGAWWPIFLLKDIIEEPGGETLFSYSVSKYMWGTYRISVYSLLYLILICLLLIAIDPFYDESLFISLFTQIGLESLFFSSLGFLTMVLCRNTGWALVLVAIYASTQILTGGELFSVINVYWFNHSLIPLNEQINHLGKWFIFSVILWIFAQTEFNKLQKFR
ncbi:hypothetical protein [Cohnella soli]|uniref:ABC transporter permease n=1 Tax=Cohnella soli TaxID=425005 RepID=A0ABW0HR73_9BACL